MNWVKNFAGVVPLSKYATNDNLPLACGHTATDANPTANFLGYILHQDSSMFQCTICHSVTRIAWKGRNLLDAKD